jgi:hypothetical protein
MLKRTLPMVCLLLIFSSCFTGDVKKNMESAIKESQDLFAEQNFKAAIGNIELHKIRFGRYPETLRDLKFLNALDSSFIGSVEYRKLENGYELNIKQTYASLSGNSDITVALTYPDEFWQGLGCVRSNVKSMSARRDSVR